MVRFQAVYKKLLRESVSLKDLRDLEPQIAKGLEELFVYQGDVESTFCQNFQVPVDVFCRMEIIKSLYFDIQIDFQMASSGVILRFHLARVMTDMFILQITYEYFGEMKIYDLVEDGGNITVTNDNRERY